MTDLEIVTLFGFGVMTVLWFRARAVISELRTIIIRVGLNELQIETDSKDMVVRITRKET